MPTGGHSDARSRTSFTQSHLPSRAGGWSAITLSTGGWSGDMPTGLMIVRLTRLMGLHNSVVVGIVLALTAGLMSPGCTDSSPTAASSSPAVAVLSTLRLVNAGSLSVAGLVVVFPNERVDFGDVAAGTVTAYRPFSRGVYRYAAYQARLGDRIVSQPVIDWVGEVPMSGEAFTYTIEASEGPPWGVNIRLVATARDR